MQVGKLRLLKVALLQWQVASSGRGITVTFFGERGQKGVMDVAMRSNTASGLINQQTFSSWLAASSAGWWAAWGTVPTSLCSVGKDPCPRVLILSWDLPLPAGEGSSCQAQPVLSSVTCLPLPAADKGLLRPANHPGPINPCLEPPRSWGRGSHGCLLERPQPRAACLGL